MKVNQVEISDKSKYIAMLDDCDLKDFAGSIKNCYFWGHRNFMGQNVVCFCLNDNVHFLNDFDMVFEYKPSGSKSEKLVEAWRKFMVQKVSCDEKFADYNYDLAKYLLDSVHQRLGI